MTLYVLVFGTYTQNCIQQAKHSFSFLCGHNVLMDIEQTLRSFSPFFFELVGDSNFIFALSLSILYYAIIFPDVPPLPHVTRVPLFLYLYLIVYLNIPAYTQVSKCIPTCSYVNLAVPTYFIHTT